MVKPSGKFPPHSRKALSRLPSHPQTGDSGKPARTLSSVPASHKPTALTLSHGFDFQKAIRSPHEPVDTVERQPSCLCLKKACKNLCAQSCELFVNSSVGVRLDNASSGQHVPHSIVSNQRTPLGQIPRKRCTQRYRRVLQYHAFLQQVSPSSNYGIEIIRCAVGPPARAGHFQKVSLPVRRRL